MTPEAVAEIFRKTDVEVLATRFVFENVNVMEFHLTPSRLACRVVARSSLARFRPAFALCAPARQSSLLSLCSERRLVEARGVEPLSLTDLPAATTCLVG